MVESYGFTQESMTPDRLVAGVLSLVTKGIALITGQNLTRGTLLGKITKALGAVVAGGGNTGNGTVTGVTLGAKALLGNYTLKCIAAAANGGAFRVEAPDGTALPDASVGAAYANAQINFTINDGGTDFAVNDIFTVPVNDGSGKFNKSLAAAVDGSQDPVAVLAKDTDATAADVETVAYETGEFNDNAVTFGTGHTAASVVEGLKKRGIHLKSPVKA